MITYGAETLFDVTEEVDSLLEAHYRELAKHQDRIKLKPDWERYAAMERAGNFLLYTARDDGDLIGYSAFFVCQHPHYADLTLVNNDVLYLDQPHRVGRTGIRFIEFCESEILAKYGNGFSLCWHAKENTPLAGILHRRGYGTQDIILSKLF